MYVICMLYCIMFVPYSIPHADLLEESYNTPVTRNSERLGPIPNLIATVVHTMKIISLDSTVVYACMLSYHIVCYVCYVRVMSSRERRGESKRSHIPLTESPLTEVRTCVQIGHMYIMLFLIRTLYTMKRVYECMYAREQLACISVHCTHVRM